MSPSAGDSEDIPDIDPTVRALAIALKSVKSSGTTPNNQHGDLFDNAGHTANRYFLNLENPKNRLLEKVRRPLSRASNRVNVASASSRSGSNKQKSRNFEIVVTTT